MSNINPPFRNLSLDSADMIAVNEAYDLACQTLHNIGQLEVDPETRNPTIWGGWSGFSQANLRDS
jgi:hypothetical protein